MALQLTDGDGKSQLNEARQALKAAADLVVGVSYAVNELAHFLYAVDEGDARKMLKAARRALGSTSKLARLQDEIDFPASTKKSQHARG